MGPALRYAHCADQADDTPAGRQCSEQHRLGGPDLGPRLRWQAAVPRHLSSVPRHHRTGPAAGTRTHVDHHDRRPHVPGHIGHTQSAVPHARPPGAGTLHTPAGLSSNLRHCRTVVKNLLPTAVVAAVGEQLSRTVAGPAGAALDMRNRVEQGQQLSDVVPITAGEHDGQRGAVRVGDHMVFRARVWHGRPGLGPVLGPPRSACRCEPSISGRVHHPTAIRPPLFDALNEPVGSGQRLMSNVLVVHCRPGRLRRPAAVLALRPGIPARWDVAGRRQIACVCVSACVLVYVCQSAESMKRSIRRLISSAWSIWGPWPVSETISARAPGIRRGTRSTCRFGCTRRLRLPSTR